MGDKMKCANCGAWMSSESGLAVCEDCRPRFVKEPTPAVTIAVRIAVRVSRDGSWIVDGQYQMPDGRMGVSEMMHREGAEHISVSMDATVYITADLPRPVRLPVTVEGTVE